MPRNPSAHYGIPPPLKRSLLSKMIDSWWWYCPWFLLAWDPAAGTRHEKQCLMHGIWEWGAGERCCSCAKMCVWCQEVGSSNFTLWAFHLDITASITLPPSPPEWASPLHLLSLLSYGQPYQTQLPSKLSPLMTWFINPKPRF